MAKNDADWKLSRLETLLRSDWSLPLVGSYLPVVDWYSLSCASKSCHGSVLRQMPEETLAFVKDLKIARTTRLLVFANQANKKGLLDLSASLYRNPAPIIQFSFESLGYNASESKLTGRPWSELAATYSSPISLARIRPSVCATDESGRNIFYCGGRLVATKREERWLEWSDMENHASSTAAIFDVDTSSWKSMPPMPEARCGAGIFRVGKRIFIIGGEMDGGAFSELEVSRSLLCFDCVQQEWVDMEIPDFPGSAHSRFTVVVLDETTILVLGGEMITDWYHQYGPLVDKSRQVFSLDISSATWTRLPDLPESVAPETTYYQGIFVEPPRNGNEGMCVVVNNGQKSVCLVMDPQPHWRDLPDLPDDDFDRRRFGCFAVFGGGLMAAFLGPRCNQLYDLRSKVKRAVPPGNGGCTEFGISLCDSTGEECTVCLCSGDTIVPVV